MAFSSGSSSSFSAEINVTPLIDVLLVLLIIFMVIVPVIPRGLVPKSSKDTSAPVTQPAVLSVTGSPDGVSYAVNTQAVGTTALRSTLASLFSARQDRTIFLQADRSLNYDQVAYAIGEAKAAGAQTVAFMPGKTQ